MLGLLHNRHLGNGVVSSHKGAPTPFPSLYFAESRP